MSEKERHAGRVRLGFLSHGNLKLRALGRAWGHHQKEVSVVPRTDFSGNGSEGNLAEALQYVSYGWAIFPCCWPDSEGRCACGGGHVEKEVGKAPLRDIKHGWRNATRDPHVVKEWWTRWPRANIGVALSLSEPPLLVVDLDSPEAAQEAARLGLSPGPISKTGGGYHYFYRAPAGLYANGTHKGSFGKIDVLVNGYVIVPPSKHRAGRLYEWVLSPDEPLQDAPGWAVGYLGKPVAGGVVSLPAELPPIGLHELRISPRLKDLVQKGLGPEYPSRSEAIFAVLTAMAIAGHSDEEMARVLVHYPIGEKAREQGLEWMRGEIARAKEKTGTRVWTVSELLAHDFPAPSFLVPGVVPEGGVSILGGRPKIGKSWFALNFGYGLATGSSVAGVPVLKQHRVLYLALEDTNRRIKARLQKVSFAPTENLYIVTQWPRLGEGGVERLRSEIKNRGISVVIVDTLAKIRPREERGRPLYSTDYEAIDILKRLADELGVTFLVVHHLRKLEAEDPLLEVSGTTGLTGAADTVLVLKRARGEADAVLHITGRDVEEHAIALRFAGGLWMVLGDAGEYTITKERKQILDAIRELGKDARPRAIAELLEKNPVTVRRLLRKLEAEGLVRSSGGTYTVV